MFRILISQYLKGLSRNTRFDVGFILKILSVISILYLCFLISLFGVNFKEILYKLSPLRDPVRYFNDGLFYLLPLYCLLLFSFQKKNYTQIIAYLHLPISRGNIISYVLIRNLFNLLNLCMILFIIPFFWINILPNYGLIPAILYLMSILLIMIFITYFSYLLKNLSSYNFAFSLIPIVWVLLSFILKFFRLIGPRNFVGYLFSDILGKNYLSLFVILLLVTGTTILNISLLRQFLYNIYANNSGKWIKSAIIQRIRLIKIRNPYILLEINLILRNRRIRSIFTIPVYLAIMTYALFLLKPNIDNNTLFLWYLCLSGVWGYSYLQYVFSFEGCFFDFISSTGFDFKKYIKAKYLLIVLLSFFLVIIMLPIIIIRNQSIYVIGTTLLYNIGIGFNIVFLSGTFNHERIDLNKSLFLNYQGYNTIQIISMVLAIFVPVGFMIITSTYLGEIYGLSVLNIISVVSLLSSKKWIRLIYKNLLKRKYINLEGYRQ